MSIDECVNDAWRMRAYIMEESWPIKSVVSMKNFERLLTIKIFLVEWRHDVRIRRKIIRRKILKSR